MHGPELIEAAWVDHRSSLVRRLTILTRDPDVAEDLTQEAFLRLAREIDAGRAPDDVAAWLHRVAGNLVNSRGRHLTVVDRRAGDLPRPDSPASPESISIEAETNEAIHLALEFLGEDGRQAVLLAAQGYRGPEIAEAIGRTQGATRTLLCRARRTLRGHLELAGVGAS